MNKQRWWSAGAVLSIGLLLAVFNPARRPDLWLTPEQRGERLFRAGHFAEAARTYQDPSRQGVAWYRAGDFKQAAAAFAHASSPEAAYDRGNAFVLLGKYDDAIKSYDRALSLRPGWTAAQDNKQLATVRRDRLRTKGGDASGGQVKADAIVFEKGKSKASAERVEMAGGPPLSDEELRSTWLRRVQTQPADFLRAKFAYQRQQQEGGAP